MGQKIASGLVALVFVWALKFGFNVVTTEAVDSWEGDAAEWIADENQWVEEELAFARLAREMPDPSRFHYRKRPRNTERKAGNIADFCARWGDEYRYMIVFDADSGAGVYGPIGLAVASGLVVSTALTLLVLPALLSIAMDVQRVVHRLVGWTA